MPKTAKRNMFPSNCNNPLESNASKEVANLTERKNPPTPIYVRDGFDFYRGCLDVSH